MYKQEKFISIAIYMATLLLFKIWWILEYQGVKLATIDSQRFHQAFQLPSYYACEFRKYPSTAHNSGLPFLGDVFASDNGTIVNFIAINKGGCLREWSLAQEFHSTPHDNPKHFMCSFPDGSVTLSEPVHRKSDNDFMWTNSAMVIRCPIPPKFRPLVQHPQTHTEFVVSLHATLDLEANTSALGDAHQSYRNLPVCHGEWPQPDGSIRPPPKKPYQISLVTRLITSYTPSGYAKSLSISKSMVIAWIEYHLKIGFEQIYVLDSTPEQHGALEQWLKPYVDTQQVTYVWFPYEDCFKDYNVVTNLNLTNRGARLPIGQYVSTNAALRRYAHQTEWMAHWDIDEYFVLPSEVEKIQDVVAKISIANTNSFDSYNVKLYWYSACNGTTIYPGMLPMERARCYIEDTTVPKSIMRTSRVLYFLVHNAIATVDGQPLHKNLIDKSSGYLAHYRQRPFFAYDKPDFSRIAKSNFTNYHDPLAKYVEYLREKVLLRTTNESNEN